MICENDFIYAPGRYTQYQIDPGPIKSNWLQLDSAGCLCYQFFGCYIKMDATIYYGSVDYEALFF